jgi:hypothetical protein
MPVALWMSFTNAKKLHAFSRCARLPPVSGAKDTLRGGKSKRRVPNREQKSVVAMHNRSSVAENPQTRVDIQHLGEISFDCAYGPFVTEHDRAGNWLCSRPSQEL